MSQHLVSEAVRCRGLVRSGWSKLKMALSSSSEVAEVWAGRGDVVLGVEMVCVEAGDGEGGRAEGEEGSRLSLGSEPLVLILKYIQN